MKARPPDGRTRLYALWLGIEVRRSRDQKTSALYRLRLQENWEKYTLDQREGRFPPPIMGQKPNEIKVVSE